MSRAVAGPEAPQPLIYLAGPVDDVEPDVALGWREKVAADWPDVLFFCPPTAFLNGKMDNAPLLQIIEHHIIDRCSGMLAKLDGPGRGFGTIREIEYAISKSRPVVLVGDFESTLMAWDCIVADDIEEGMRMLMEEMMKIREMMQHPPFPFGLLGMQQDDPSE